MTNAPPFVVRTGMRSTIFGGAFAESLKDLLFGDIFKVFASLPVNQDAPRVSSASNRRRARTRLARPKSESNCAVFFANPR